ncbi:MAG: WG repeat-containing protein [Clostridia bacterium]|nr:WG repeat-containing protein [Clostridia bacterium]
MQSNKWICGLLALMMILLTCACAYAGERYVWGYQGDVAYFEENGLIGLLDRQGNVLIEPRFTEVEPFRHDFAKVKEGDLLGVITIAGDIIAEPAMYEYLNFISDGIGEPCMLLAYKDTQEQMGIITLEGEIIPETQWDSPTIFRNGIAIVEKDKEYNLLNSFGELLLEQWWPAIEPPGAQYWVSPIVFLDVQDEQGLPLFRVRQRNLSENDLEEITFGIVNTLGKWIIPCEWERIVPVGNTLFLVGKEGNWGGLDYAGNMVIPLEWDGLTDANEGLLLALKDEKKGYINLRGEIVIPLEWDHASTFEGGMAVVKKGRQQGIIDPTGTFVIPLQTTYSFADEINGAGYIQYSRGNNWGLMDKEGNVLSSVNYRTTSNNEWATKVDFKAWPHFNVLLYDGFCEVIDNRDRSNLMDVNGNMLFPKFIKARIVHFRYGLGFLSEDLGNYSLINTKGEHLTDAIWSTARDFRQFGDQLIAEVRYNPTGRPGDGVQGYINEWGEPIVGIKLPKAE